MVWTCNTIDIISLKKPTALDKVIESIPKPKGAIPNFGLPKWKVMPLESKIPMVPGPEGAYNFTRRKIGKKLWTSSSDAEFNLYDPYCHEIKFTYDSLHDEHLVPFFSKANNIKHLLKAGLITHNLEGKCSLKDYNIYRKYLRNLHIDSIKRELRERTRLSHEKQVLEYAEEQARNEVKKLERRERLVEASQKIWKARKLQEEAKIQAQKEKAKLLKERMKLLIITKHEEQMKRAAKAKARCESIKQKQKLAAEIERQKKINTLVDWRKKEHIRKKAREARLKYIQEQKIMAIEEKWKLRHESQKKDIEKEQFLFDCINTQRAVFIKKYNQKIEKEKKRMDSMEFLPKYYFCLHNELLQRMKIFVHCYMARRLPKGKERICCRSYYVDQKSEDKNKSFISNTSSTLPKDKETTKTNTRIIYAKWQLILPILLASKPYFNNNNNN
ncbi:fibrous sheath-interacting protein 2 isoform X1 [Vespula squamosa]|uniref:Fibrous sheath-interacting protein 2 isoform X1 n=1 Tax=Vespula squamosa TaxID=30214 RepID=A0ABD2B8E9_VESSQ